MNEKELLKQEIEKLKKDLSDYLSLYKKLGISEEEKQRTVDIFLDDMNNRIKEIKKKK